MSNQYEIPILKALNENGGFTTGYIAASFPSPFAHRSKREHSSDVRSWLLHMMGKGWVRPMDDQKPVCWTRTTAGTRAMKAAK